VAAQVLPGRLTFQHASGAREEPELVGERRHFVSPRQGEWLAGVPRLCLDEVLSPGLDGVGEFQQREAALRRGGVTPRLECRGRRPQRHVHVGKRRYRRPEVDLAGARVDDLTRSPVLNSHVLPAHEVREHLLAARLPRA
jgi:hypothetical protein